MNLVDIKCINCGADLKVDNTLDVVTCEYCGSKFTHEALVKSGAFSDDELEVDTLVKSVRLLLKTGDFDRAKPLIDKLINEYAYDYRGWWALLAYKTNNFTPLPGLRIDLNTLDNDYKKVIALNPDNDEIKNTYKEYKQGMMNLQKEYDSNHLSDYRNAISNYNTIKYQLNMKEKVIKKMFLYSILVLFIAAISMFINVYFNFLAMTVLSFFVIIASFLVCTYSKQSRDNKANWLLTKELSIAQQSVYEARQEYEKNSPTLVTLQ